MFGWLGAGSGRDNRNYQWAGLQGPTLPPGHQAWDFWPPTGSGRKAGPVKEKSLSWTLPGLMWLLFNTLGENELIL